jgi:hypothetical protein
MQLFHTYPKDTKSFGYFIVSTFLLFCSPVCAQTVSPISKDYLIELHKNKKPFSQIQMADNLSKKIDYKPKFIKVNYQKSLKFDINPIKVRPLTSKKLHSNYISAGIGNYQTSYTEAFFSTRRQNKYAYSLFFRHLSHRLGMVDARNSGNATNEICFDFQSFTKTGIWSGKVGFQQQKWHFYGYRPFEPSVPQARAIEQRFNIINGELGYANKYSLYRYTYHLGISFQHFADAYTAQEQEIGGKFESKMRFNTNSNLFFKAQISSSERQDSAEKQHRNLFLGELYHQLSNVKFNLQIGGRVALHNDTLQSQKAIYVYPKLHFSLNIFKNKLNIHAQIEGNMQKRLLQTMLIENPFLDRNVVMAHTNKVWEASIGLRTQLVGAFNWQVKFGHGIYQNLYFFTNSPARPSRFSVVYETANIPVSKLTNEFMVNLKKLKVKLQTELFDYQMQPLVQAWHRPLLTNTLSVNYSLNRCLIQFDFYHLAGITAFDIMQAKNIDLQPITDLNIKIDYHFLPQWSLFLKGNNLLAQPYQRYLYYEVRTAQVIGGVNFTF